MIESLEPKDRFNLYTEIINVLAAINASCNGWMQWCSNPGFMAKFSEEQLRSYFTRLREFALAFMKYDLEVSEPVEKMREKESQPYI